MTIRPERSEKDVNPADGAKLQLWDCAGTANPKWRKG